MKDLKFDRNVLRMSAVLSRARDGLDELHELAELSERLLKNELQVMSFAAEVKDNIQDFPEDEPELYLYDDDIYRLSEAFPRIQRYSLFIATMSAIEHYLNQLCKVAKEISDHSLSPSDLNGRGIMRSISYLTKVCGYKLSKGTGSETHDLEVYQKIRNAIIHANGLAKDQDLKAIKHFQTNNQSFKFNGQNQLIFSSSFVPAVIYIAGNLFEKILVEMRKKIKITKSSIVK